MYFYSCPFITASTNNNSKEYGNKESNSVLRNYNDKLCSILNTSESTLLSLSSELYTRRIIDQHTKINVRRVKGFEGADILMDHVETKVDQNHECLDVVLQIMEKQESLCNLVRRMRKGNIIQCCKKTILLYLYTLENTRNPICDNHHKGKLIYK